MDIKGWWKYELALPGLVLALVLVLVLIAAAGAAPVAPFPVTQGNCGTLGNVLATAQHMRNEGMTLEGVKKILKESSEECVRVNGADNCILQDKAGQEMLNSMVETIWSLPPVDPTDFGFQVYQQCLQANKGKST